MQLSPEEVVQFSTEPEVLADGLHLANHFHALSLGLRRASVAASMAWLLTGIAHEVQNSPDLNPDGLDRAKVAKWLLAVIDVQLDAIAQLDTAGLDAIDELAGTREIAAPASIGPTRERAHAPGH